MHWDTVGEHDEQAVRVAGVLTQIVLGPEQGKAVAIITIGRYLEQIQFLMARSMEIPQHIDIYLRFVKIGPVLDDGMSDALPREYLMQDDG